MPCGLYSCSTLPQGPALRPRPPGLSGPSGPWVCLDGHSGSGEWRCATATLWPAPAVGPACIPNMRAAPSACSLSMAWAPGGRPCSRVWRRCQVVSCCMSHGMALSIVFMRTRAGVWLGSSWRKCIDGAALHFLVSA